MHAVHLSISALVWIFSLVLQAALFISLFWRRIAGRFPLFTALIGFYLIRSTLLYLVFGYISASTYSELYNVLLLLDILVQGAVVVELTSTLIREQGGWTLRRALFALALLGLAAIGTSIIVGIFPHPRIPIDRSQPFFALVLIFLCGWALSIRSSKLVVRITQGFAFYGIMNLIATVGRTLASAHNHSRRYAGWSYTLAAAYLVVILFWLLSLKHPMDKAASSYQLSTHS